MGHWNHYEWKDLHYHLINKEVYVTILHGDQRLVQGASTSAFSICSRGDNVEISCYVIKGNTFLALW